MEEEACDTGLSLGSGPGVVGGCGKRERQKKHLRLTKEQSNLLEDHFRQHRTLNPIRKKALAETCDLLPRQVEVWFQNRRARTKLKQTEVNYMFLKKSCESLSSENVRLKTELMECKKKSSILVSRSSTSGFPLDMQIPKAVPTMRVLLCPSCERIKKNVISVSSFDIAAVNVETKPKLYGYCTTISGAH